MDVVGGEVDTWEEFVESFGDGWEVVCSPCDRSLCFGRVSVFIGRWTRKDSERTLLP